MKKSYYLEQIDKVPVALRPFRNCALGCMGRIKKKISNKKLNAKLDTLKKQDKAYWLAGRYFILGRGSVMYSFNLKEALLYFKEAISIYSKLKVAGSSMPYSHNLGVSQKYVKGIESSNYLF